MANLLPEKKMSAVQAEFRNRFAMTGGLLLAISALVFFLTLLPSYIILSFSEPPEAAVQAAREDKQGFDDLSRVQIVTRDVNIVLAASSSPSKAISQMMALRPKGVSINNFSYTVGSTGASMSVSGMGANRDAINDFRDALLKNGKFPTVSIPVGDILGTSLDGNFTATISTKY